MNSTEWLSILREAAVNIYAAVSAARPMGVGMETRNFKRLLDEAAQGALVEALQRRGVCCSLISEEGNKTINGGGPIVIADPVDGTTNLSRGIQSAVACLSASENEHQSGTLAAVVKDLYTGETYAAERGKGATLDGKPIYVAAPRQPRDALITFDLNKTPKIDRITPLLGTCRYIRMLGSSATELSLIASGNIDAHVDIRGTLRATDVAAALTILTEAGGKYSVDGKIGGDFTLTKETVMELIAASDEVLLGGLLALTKAHSRPPA
jgi:myo-inositol-1(or 4)-monophosphatase